MTSYKEYSHTSQDFYYYQKKIYYYKKKKKDFYYYKDSLPEKIHILYKYSQFLSKQNFLF